MKADKKNNLFLILPTLVFLLVGCSAIQQPVDVFVKPVGSTRKYQNDAVSKRFRQAVPEKQTAVDSAIELSKKYAELSDEKDILRQKNHFLTNENLQLKKRIAALEPELKQAKRELTEANDFLIEMTIELNNWKMQILGFQDEIRESFTVQGELLLKIAYAMDAELILKQDENKQSTETLTTGEPNE